LFAEAASRWLARRGIHYAWAMMVVGFLVMLVSSSALGLPGAFLRPLSHEFGWTTGQISSAIAIRFALFGLIGPFAAILIERHGLRRIACTALLLIAAGMLLATRMTALWQLFILWGLVLGVGSGLTALVLAATLANRWFERRRHGGRIFGSLCGPCARSRRAAPSGCSRARSSSVD
jgi:MFS family permease